MGFGFALRPDHASSCLFNSLVMLGLRPHSRADKMLLKPLNRVSQRKALPIVSGAVFGWVVGRGMRPSTIGHPFDDRRAQVTPSSFGGPLGHSINGKEVIAIGTQGNNACSDAARCKGGVLAAGKTLKG